MRMLNEVQKLDMPQMNKAHGVFMSSKDMGAIICMRLRARMFGVL